MKKMTTIKHRDVFKGRQILKETRNNWKFLDAPLSWQMGFQNPSTKVMEHIIDLDFNIMFFLVWIILFVSIILGYFMYSETAILLLIAVPSFILLYNLGQIAQPEVILKGIGHQWCWEYYNFRSYSISNNLLLSRSSSDLPFGAYQAVTSVADTPIPSEGGGGGGSNKIIGFFKKVYSWVKGWFCEPPLRDIWSMERMERFAQGLQQVSDAAVHHPRGQWMYEPAIQARRALWRRDLAAQLLQGLDSGANSSFQLPSVVGAKSAAPLVEAISTGANPTFQSPPAANNFSPQLLQAIADPTLFQMPQAPRLETLAQVEAYFQAQLRADHFSEVMGWVTFQTPILQNMSPVLDIVPQVEEVISPVLDIVPQVEEVISGSEKKGL